MKKVIALVGMVLLLSTGCGNETKTMVCTRTVNQSGVQMDLRYEVEYTKDTVDKVKSIEKVVSDDEDVLKATKETVEKQFKAYTDIEHYDTDIQIEGNTLTSITTIDYTKIDTAKLIEVDSSIGEIIKDGKIKIDDMENIYKLVGATCER